MSQFSFKKPISQKLISPK